MIIRLPLLAGAVLIAASVGVRAQTIDPYTPPANRTACDNSCDDALANARTICTRTWGSGTPGYVVCERQAAADHATCRRDCASYFPTCRTFWNSCTKAAAGGLVSIGDCMTLFALCLERGSVPPVDWR